MKVLFAFLLVGLLAVPSVSAEDPGPRYDYMRIYDIPHSDLLARYGRLPGTLLAEEGLEDDCPGYICYLGDTLKMLAILIEWDDRPHTYEPAVVESRIFSRGVWPDGSLAEYYDEVSFGHLTVVGGATEWFNAGSFVPDPPQTYWDSIIAALDPYIDYSQYDANSDGYVDAIAIIQAGNNTIESGSATDAHAIAWWYPPEYALGPFDGVMATRFHTSPETSPIRSSEEPFGLTSEDTVANIVIQCHEFGHNLALPDLYDIDYDKRSFYTPGDDDDHPMVDWCLMDGSQEGYAFEIGMPAHLCGWSKMKLHWLDPITLAGEYEDLVIYNIEGHSDSALYLLPIDEAEGEYFLLEYRNPEGSHRFGKLATDFSREFYPDLAYGADPIDRGLLITHVDDSLSNAFYNVWNSGTPMYPHYAITVVDAGYDPARDLEYNPEGQLTDSAQWWYPYETRLGAAFSSDVPEQNEFGPYTTPSSDGYFGPSGIYVRVDSIVDDRLYMYVNKPEQWVCIDGDGDGYGDPDHPENTCPDDNCPDVYNPDQLDSNGNGIGDACEVMPYVCGDANGDGEVTQADVNYLIEFLHKDGPAPVPMEAGDANGDGQVNDLDAKYLIDYLHKDGPEPVCP